VPSTSPTQSPSRPSAPPLVIQTEHLDAAPARWLAERCRVEVCPVDDPRFEPLAREAEGLLVRTYTRVDAGLLDRCPRLRVVARAGVGLDNIDLAACARRGVRVVSTPEANSSAVVEYVLALLLDATRPRAFLHEPLSPEAWRATRRELTARRQLCQLTLGIWGFGRIGRRLARAAAALNMPVIYHDLLEIAPEQRHGAAPAGWQDLCARADVVSVHVDGRESNRGLISTDALGRMKSDVIFINTSRGFVVDAWALAEFMIGHPAAQALLDVHDPEPFDATYPLLNIPNVHLSAHIASCTRLAQENMSWVVRDLWAVLSGEAPRHEALPGPSSVP
jgi:phosphoglycerate dehydrogenase-like enzyme